MLQDTAYRPYVFSDKYLPIPPGSRIHATSCHGGDLFANASRDDSTQHVAGKRQALRRGVSSTPRQVPVNPVLVLPRVPFARGRGM